MLIKLKIALGIAILLSCNCVFAESVVCVTEVRNFCNDFEPCVRNVDKEKSTHSINLGLKEIVIHKTIGGLAISNWRAKLVNISYDESRTYLELGGASTLFTLNKQNTRFVLTLPSSTSAQVEIGICL